MAAERPLNRLIVWSFGRWRGAGEMNEDGVAARNAAYSSDAM